MRTHKKTHMHMHRHAHAHTWQVQMHYKILLAFWPQTIPYSPCVKQRAQAKINPSPYTSQVCKVMDAAQYGWWVLSAGGERVTDSLCSHLIARQNRQREKSSRDPTCQSLSSPTVSLNLSLREAHAVCERTASESPVREGANHPASQSAQHPVRGGRKISEQRN